MCLDETGSTTNLLRRYGRAPRGARVHDHAPCGRWQTSTFLAALRVTGLTAPGVFDGAIDGESFRAYIEQILVPTLQPGDIVMADTISGPTRSPASNAPSRLPGPPSGTCHPIARTSIPSSSASRSSRPSFAPLAVAAPRRSGRSSASAGRTSALTHAATIFGTAGTRPPHGHEKRFKGCDWPSLRDESGTTLIDHYIDVLRTLGKTEGILGDIYSGAQSRFNNPVNLKRMINLIDETEWTSLGVDVKAEAYEGLLEKAASEGKKGAG